jgi:hypothetical protein
LIVAEPVGDRVQPGVKGLHGVGGGVQGGEGIDHVGAKAGNVRHLIVANACRKSD